MEVLLWAVVDVPLFLFFCSYGTKMNSCLPEAVQFVTLIQELSEAE